MKKRTNNNNNSSVLGYRIVTEKAFMDFLRPMHEERFTKMDAYCYLLDKALDSAKDAEDSSSEHSSAGETPFVITVTNLAETWNWHRATVRNFLDELVSRGRMTKQAQSKSYLITMKLDAYSPTAGCPYAVVVDDIESTRNVAPISGKQSGQMSESDEESTSEQFELSLTDATEDMLHAFFTFMAATPNGYDILAKNRPANLIKSFNTRFGSDAEKHQLAVNILARSLQTSVPPSQCEAVGKMTNSERDLLDRIYLRYICLRCASANCNI